jgi:hypothetical protein
MSDLEGNFVRDPESVIRMKIADILRAMSRGTCSSEQLLAASERVAEAARILEKGVTMESVNG